MSVYLEQHIPVVKYEGLNTTKDVNISGSVTISGASAISGTTTFTGGILKPVADLTAASTLSSAYSGYTLFLNSTTEFATTLPSPAAGLNYKFVVKAAPSGASYTVVTGGSANIIIGGINELEVDTGDDGPYDADGDTITFADGVAVVGDWVELISDGTSWYLTGQANADGGITVTKAS